MDLRFISICFLDQCHVFPRMIVLTERPHLLLLRAASLHQQNVLVLLFECLNLLQEKYIIEMFRHKNWAPTAHTEVSLVILVCTSCLPHLPWCVFSERMKSTLSEESAEDQPLMKSQKSALHFFKYKIRG